jgi:nitrite reductase (NADH) small subunit/3-phenylpropionate/trans-cinnamate dioxygenase ferredoxin subunit
MSEFTKVAKVGAVPDGEGRAFTVDGRVVGIFLIDGEYFAINDLCPHMGASLASGHVEDHAVTCPWHAWRFSVKDGTWLDNPSGVKTDSWSVRLEEDSIQVAVPPKDPPPECGSSDPGQAGSPPADCGSGCGASTKEP